MKNMKKSNLSIKGYCHGITTLGERGQLVIPQEVRRKLKLQQKDKLFVFSRFDKIIVLVKVKEIQNLFDLLVPAGISIKMVNKKKRK